MDIWDHVITKVVIVTLTVLVMSAALAMARRPARVNKATGAAILTYNWIWRGLALMMAALVPCAIASAMFDPRTEPWVAVAIIVPLTAAAIAFLLGTFYSRVVLTEAGMLFRSPWRGRRTLIWQDIVRVSYSSFSRWFVLRDGNGVKYRVSVYMVGIREFVAQLRSHVPRDIRRDAEAGFDDVERRLIH